MKVCNLAFLILFFTFQFFSCKKKEPVKKYADMSLKWIYDLGPNFGNGINFIHENTYIQAVNDATSKAKILFLDKQTGEKIWESATFYNWRPFTTGNTQLKDDLLISLQRNNLRVFDIKNKKMKWELDLVTPKHSFNLIEDYIYLAGKFAGEDFLTRVNINTREKEILYRKVNVNIGYYFEGFTAPEQWRHPSGDLILLMANRFSDRQNGSEFHRYDQLAYNISADTLLWYREGKDNEKGSLATPLIIGNKVMYYGEREMICLNPLNGERIWTFTRTPADDISGFNTAKITHIGNTIIAKPDYKYMYGVDLQTGNTLWTNSENSSMSGTVRVALNKVWFSSGGIWCIDGVTGKTLINGWQNKTPGNFISPIAIDEKTGYIYTQKQGIIYCLDSKVLME